MGALWNRLIRYKFWLGLLLCLGLAAGGGYYYKQGTKVVSTPAATVAAGRGDIRSTVAATGTISAVNSVDISSRVTGLITEMNVKENDIVKKGQVLLVLDDTALRAQLNQYQAQVANYEAVYERSQKLAAMGGEAQQQLDSDRMNYQVAKANYDNYQSQLGYYVITAPIDGIVVGTPTPAGQTVAQGISTPQVIMTIADMSVMKIKVLVDETDIGKVKDGNPVTFTVDAYSNKIFTGKVSSISRSATTSSNVVYYPVYVEVDSPEGLLFPTMTARATIQVGESKNAILVPVAAVKEQNGQQYVQVNTNGRVENRNVTTGLTDEEKIEIIDGLSEGETVVVPETKAQTTNKKQNQNQGPPPI